MVGAAEDGKRCQRQMCPLDMFLKDPGACKFLHPSESPECAMDCSGLRGLPERAQIKTRYATHNVCNVTQTLRIG
jgi:hypothetical protein